MPGHDEPAVNEFIERFGLLWDRFGANRTMGRMIGWLMTCDPGDPTADDLADALQVSKASVSTTTRALETMGLVERVRRPGERKLRYRMPPGAWDNTMRVRVRELEHVRELAERGERALGDRPAEQRQRIEEFRIWATWWLRRHEELLQEWEEWDER